MKISAPISEEITHNNLPQAIGKIWDEVLKMRTELSDLKQNFEPKLVNEYLTRNELAAMLKVDLSTIHNWCKRGKIVQHNIGNRVYFLRSEIEAVLTPAKK